MQLDRLDHLVLTVGSIEVTCAFYEQVLGLMTSIYFRDPDLNLIEVAYYPSGDSNR